MNEYKKKALDCFAQGATCGLDVLEAIGRYTTCYNDLMLSEIFGGDKAVEELVDSWLKDWGDDVCFMAELYCDLNHKIWEWHDKGSKHFEELYTRLWCKVGKFTDGRFKGEDATYFYRMTD